jgi:hypothetical protein
VTAPTCERRIWRNATTRPCGQQVALTRWTDSAGTPHVACSRHVAELEHRYPIREPLWLHEDPGYDDAEQADPITAAKGYTFDRYGPIAPAPVYTEVDTVVGLETRVTYPRP